MNKQEYIALLRKGLTGLPQEDIEERAAFYGEMIDDRMEDGLSEEEAVSEIGDIDEIIAQIIADIPFAKLVKEKIKPKKRLSAPIIVLLILGSPLWLSLLIAGVAVFLSLYVSLWAVVVSMWAVFVSLAVSGLAAAVWGIVIGFANGFLTGIAVIGAGLVCAGLSIFMFYLCMSISKGIAALTKKLTVWIKVWVKNCFAGKEEA